MFFLECTLLVSTLQVPPECVSTLLGGPCANSANLSLCRWCCYFFFFFQPRLSYLPLSWFSFPPLSTPERQPQSWTLKVVVKLSRSPHPQPAWWTPPLRCVLLPFSPGNVAKSLRKLCRAGLLNQVCDSITATKGRCHHQVMSRQLAPGIFPIRRVLHLLAHLQPRRRQTQKMDSEKRVRLVIQRLRQCQPHRPNKGHGHQLHPPGFPRVPQPPNRFNTTTARERPRPRRFHHLKRLHFVTPTQFHRQNRARHGGMGAISQTNRSSWKHLTDSIPIMFGRG